MSGTNPKQQPMSQAEHEVKMKEYTDNCQEVVLYLMVHEMGLFLHNMNNYVEVNGKSQDMDIINKVARVKADMERVVVDQAIVFKTLNDRFNINVYDNNGEPSKNYWKWFNHWEKWRVGVPESTWKEVDASVKMGKPVKEELLPKNRWDAPDPDDLFVVVPDTFIKDDPKEGRVMVQDKSFWDWVTDQNTKLNAQYVSVDERMVEDNQHQFVILLKKKS